MQKYIFFYICTYSRHNKDEIMLKPLVDFKKWANDHEISTRTVRCPNCSNDLIFNVPIAMKGYRGLKTWACDCCGKDSGIFRVVPIDPDKLRL